MTLMKLSACGSACILTVLWAVGAAGLTLFFLLGYLRTLRALSGARQAPDAGIWLSSCGLRFHRTISIRLLDDARCTSSCVRMYILRRASVSRCSGSTTTGRPSP